MSHIPSKRFGQNFLIDTNIIDRIITAIAPSPQDVMVEIGPGQGALTLKLLRILGHLDAVELDRTLIEPLTRKCVGQGRLILHNRDALTFDLCQLATSGRKLRLVGNLPYNISTPLLFRFLHQKECIQDMHLMLQKEVVDRIIATPGSRTYGRLSVMVQTWCRAESIIDIPPEAFFPVPKVYSTLLRLIPFVPVPYHILDQQHYARLVAQAFSQRRKTLRNSMKGHVSDSVYSLLNIDATQRAEELSVSTYVSLANLTFKNLSESNNP